MDRDLASKLAGMLYGNILHRNSDDDGFDYHFRMLKDDKFSLNELIIKFFTSDEFMEKFVVNQTPNELITNLLQSFFGSAVVKAADHSSMRKILVHDGLYAVIQKLVEDKRFAKTSSANTVPRYLERSDVHMVQAAAE